MTVRILVSSAGNKTTLISCLIQTLGNFPSEYQIWFSDFNSNNLNRHIYDNFVEMPKTDSSNLNRIIEILKNISINYVLPTRDGELLFWAQHLDYFENHGIKILTSPTQAIKLSLDKYEFFQVCRNASLPVIPTSLTPNFDVAEYVVKERYGSGSQKLGLKLDRNKAIQFAKNIEEAIYQPYIEGDEFSVDVWTSSKSDLAIALPRWRECVIQGESKITKIFRNEELERLAIETSRLLGITGICVIQGILEKSGQVSILECNARIGGATTASIYAGLPLLELLIQHPNMRDEEVLLKNLNLRNLRQVRVSVDRIYDDSCI